MSTDRARPTIELKSPDGKEFSAKWVGGTRSFSKRLALYNYADINGTVVDDFGADSYRYPISMIFDAKGYNKTVDDFAEACREIGKWEVIHPTKGFMGLQLMSFSEQDQPVQSANSITVDTEWIEYIDPNFLVTAAQLSEEVGDQIGLFNDSTAGRFSRVKIDRFSDRSKLSDMAEKMAAGVDKVLGPIADQNSKISQKMLRAQRDIQSMIASGIIEPLKLAGQIQEMIQTPMFALRDLKSRLRACKTLAENIFAQNEFFDSGNDNRDNGNKALMQELALSSVMTNMANLATTSELNSREEAILLIEEIEYMKKIVAEHQGNLQEQLGDALIDEQYFMQEGSYDEMLAMLDKAKQLLLQSTSDLKVAKRVILTKPVTTIELAAQYYGVDSTDENWVYFLSTNNITGKDIFILQPGTEIVIYV